MTSRNPWPFLSLLAFAFAIVAFAAAAFRWTTETSVSLTPLGLLILTIGLCLMPFWHVT